MPDSSKSGARPRSMSRRRTPFGVVLQLPRDLRGTSWMTCVRGRCASCGNEHVRIIYLHQYFNTPEMAGSTRSYEIARRLVAAGHTVDLVTSWRQPAETKGWRQTELAGMRVHWLAVPYYNQMSYRSRIRAFL